MTQRPSAQDGLPEDYRSLIWEEKSRIVDDLRLELHSSAHSFYLQVYKESLLNENALAAGEILQRLESFFRASIEIARNYIALVTAENCTAIGKLAMYKNKVSGNRFWQREIARDLHDTVLQSLTTILFEIELCQKLLDLGFDQARKEYPSLNNLLLDNIQCLDQFCSKHGCKKKGTQFLPALRSHIERFSNISGIEIQMKIKGEKMNISGELKDNLLQIIKEALINIGKHAEADNAKISLNLAPNRLKATIADDGKGFVLDKQEDEFFGIKGMRERAKIVGGKLSVKSIPGEGTTVILDIPLDKGNSAK